MTIDAVVQNYTESLRGHFELLGEYTNTRTPTLHKCLTCNTEWVVPPKYINVYLQKGRSCPVCTPSTRKYPDHIIDSILAKAGMTRLSPYLGALEKMTLRHTCGYEYNTTYAIIKAGKGCPKCNRNFNSRISDISQEAIFYILDVVTNTEHFIKVGVTTKASAQPRANDVMRSIGVKNITKCSPIHTFKGCSILIVALEREVLSNIPIYSASIKFSGHTELKHFSDLDKILEIVKEYNVIEVI